MAIYITLWGICVPARVTAACCFAAIRYSRFILAAWLRPREGSKFIPFVPVIRSSICGERYNFMSVSNNLTSSCRCPGYFWALDMYMPSQRSIKSCVAQTKARHKRYDHNPRRMGGGAARWWLTYLRFGHFAVDDINSVAQ